MNAYGQWVIQRADVTVPDKVYVPVSQLVGWGNPRGMRYTLGPIIELKARDGSGALTFDRETGRVRSATGTLAKLSGEAVVKVRHAPGMDLCLIEDGSDYLILLSLLQPYLGGNLHQAQYQPYKLAQLPWNAPAKAPDLSDFAVKGRHDIQYQEVVIKGNGFKLDIQSPAISYFTYKGKPMALLSYQVGFMLRKEGRYLAQPSYVRAMSAGAVAYGNGEGFPLGLTPLGLDTKNSLGKDVESVLLTGSNPRCSERYQVALPGVSASQMKKRQGLPITFTYSDGHGTYTAESKPVK